MSDTPDYIRPELKAVLDDLTLVDRLVEGTPAMQAHAKEAGYIRQWAKEPDSVFAIRSTMATVFEGLSRVLSASVAMMFAKPLVLTIPQMEDSITAHWWNLDGAGTKGDVLMKRFADLALRHGLAGILVDHPTPPDGVVVTEANEVALGLRPTWAVYPRATIRAWDYAVIDNATVPVMFLLSESAMVRTGRFSVGPRQRYRILELLPVRGEDGAVSRVAVWTLAEERKDAAGNKEFVEVGRGVFRDRQGRIFDRLPFSVAYTGNTDSPMTAKPPLLGVAYANLSHWRKATDLAFYEGLCAFPQPTIIGELAMDPRTSQPTELAFGPTVAVKVQSGGDYRMTELAGTSLDQLRKSLADALQQMAAMGLSFLVRDYKAETAEGQRLDAVAENATIATAATAIEDAGNCALEFHGRYLGLFDVDCPTMAINKDYSPRHLDPAQVQAVTALIGTGMPIRQALSILVRGGVIEVEDDAQAELLAAEWEAGLVAVAAEAARQLPRDDSEDDEGTE